MSKFQVLLEIFSYLSPRDRRNAALVCKNWLDVTQHVSFATDYTLQFTDFHFDDSLTLVKVFDNCIRTFPYLKMFGRISWTSEEVIRRVLKNIGPGVIDFKSDCDWLEFLQMIQPLQYFPNLKTLRVRDVNFIRQFPNLPPSLEHIHVDYLQNMEPKNIVDQLKKHPGLKNITANVCRLEGGLGYLIRLAQVFQEAAHTFVNLDFQLKMLLIELNDEYTQNVSINCNNNFLEDKNISIDDVTCIKVRQGIKTYEPLQRFPNLVGLDVIYEPNIEFICFFGHNIFLLPKLTMFRMSNTKNTCMHCFRTMIDSFPNLQKLVLQDCCFRDEHFKVINQKLVKLQKLEIKSNKLTDAIIFGDREEYLIANLTRLKSLSIQDTYLVTDTGLSKWPCMPNLVEISLGQVAPCSLRAIGKFVDALPNIKSFRIGDDSDLNDPKLEYMVRGWPKLRRLAIEGPTNISTNGWTFVKTYCQKLEVRTNCSYVLSVLS